MYKSMIEFQRFRHAMKYLRNLSPYALNSGVLAWGAHVPSSVMIAVLFPVSSSKRLQDLESVEVSHMWLIPRLNFGRLPSH